MKRSTYARKSTVVIYGALKVSRLCQYLSAFVLVSFIVSGFASLEAQPIGQDVQLPRDSVELKSRAKSELRERKSNPTLLERINRYKKTIAACSIAAGGIFLYWVLDNQESRKHKTSQKKRRSLTQSNTTNSEYNMGMCFDSTFSDQHDEVVFDTSQTPCVVDDEQSENAVDAIVTDDELDKFVSQVEGTIKQPVAVEARKSCSTEVDENDDDFQLNAAEVESTRSDGASSESSEKSDIWARELCERMRVLAAESDARAQELREKMNALFSKSFKFKGDARYQVRNQVCELGEQRGEKNEEWLKQTEEKIAQHRDDVLQRLQREHPEVGEHPVLRDICKQTDDQIATRREDACRRLDEELAEQRRLQREHPEVGEHPVLRDIRKQTGDQIATRREDACRRLDEELTEKQQLFLEQRERNRLQDECTDKMEEERRRRVRWNGESVLSRDYVRVIADELAIKASSFRERANESNDVLRRLAIAKFIERDPVHVERILASVDEQTQAKLRDRLNTHEIRDMRQLKREALNLKVEELLDCDDLTRERVEKESVLLKERLLEHEDGQFAEEISTLIQQKLTPYSVTFSDGLSRCVISGRVLDIPYFAAIMKPNFKEGLTNSIDLSKTANAEDFEWVLSTHRLIKKFGAMERKSGKPLLGRETRRLAWLQSQSAPLTMVKWSDRAYLASYLGCQHVVRVCAQFLIDNCDKENIKPSLWLDEESCGSDNDQASPDSEGDAQTVNIDDLDEVQRFVAWYYQVKHGSRFVPNISFKVFNSHKLMHCPVNQNGVPCRDGLRDPELKEKLKRIKLYSMHYLAQRSGLIDKGVGPSEFREIMGRDAALARVVNDYYEIAEGRGDNIALLRVWGAVLQRAAAQFVAAQP